MVRISVPKTPRVRNKVPCVISRHLMKLITPDNFQFYRVSDVKRQKRASRQIKVVKRHRSVRWVGNPNLKTPINTRNIRNIKLLLSALSQEPCGKGIRKLLSWRYFSPSPFQCTTLTYLRRSSYPFSITYFPYATLLKWLYFSHE